MTKDGRIKNYIKLVQPSFWRFFFLLLTAVLAYVTIPVAAIFAAKAIVCVTSGDYHGTIIYLLIELVLHLVRQVIWDINYRAWYAMYRRDYARVQNKIYKKLINGSSADIQHVGKNSIVNIVGNDVSTVVSFANTISSKSSKLIQLFITLSIVFAANVWVGMSLMLLGAIDLLILVYLNRNLAKTSRKLKESMDGIYSGVSGTIESKNLISNYNAEEYFDKQFNEKLSVYLKHQKRSNMLSNYKANWFYAFYRTIIFLITCLLVQLLSGASISLETYLLVVPYLLSCTELINEMINISYDVENLDVSTRRINTILSMSDEDLTAYGKIADKTSAEDLSFVNVSYSCTNTSSPYFGKVSGVDISFMANELNVVKGAKKSGKRLLYYLLARRVKPQEGKVLIDGIDIFGYNKNSFRKQIYTMAYKPEFLNTSLETNLKLVCKNKTKINKALKLVGLYEDIRALPEGIATNINMTGFDEYQLFLLSLARGIIAGSNVLVLYEYPNTLNEAEKLHVKDVLLSLCGKKTIVLFTAKNDFDDVSKLTYIMENGKISFKV